MSLEEILSVPLTPSPEELETDEWDGDNCVSYSSDGKRLVDAENFPPVVRLREGCEVICEDAFAFKDYMAGYRLGEDIPLDDRSSCLEKITLPSTLTHIGPAAFAECGELLSIRLPASLLYIGASAFMDCWQLERITLPSGLRYIGAGAFQGCINLVRVRLGRSLEFIGEDAFDDCESLETIAIPRGTLEHFRRLLPEELHPLIEEI